MNRVGEGRIDLPMGQGAGRTALKLSGLNQ